MNSFKILLTVRIYNQGGMPPFVKQINESNIEQARRSGSITEAQAKTYLDQLQDASRPIQEQFQFQRETKIPFVPIDGCVIRKQGFNFHANTVAWDQDAERFEAEMHKNLCNECGVGGKCPCMKTLMDDDSGWNMLPPELPDNDEKSPADS